MKRITLILGVVAVMVAMLVALSAPAMAKDNGGNKGGGKDNGGHNNGGFNRLDNRLENRLDNKLDRLDNRFDVDDGAFLVSDVDFSPVFTTNNGLADELCSPLSSDAINNAIPGCIFGDRNDDLDTGFVSDVNRVSDADFVGDIDDVDFVVVDVDRDMHFVDGNNHDGGKLHNGNGKGKNHNNGGGKKGNGK